MERHRTTAHRVAALLEKRSLKFVLALLIVVSLLPMPSLERTLRPLFLLVFGIELALRGVALSRPREEIRRFEWFFLCIDILAFASFLPLERVLGSSSVSALVALRLTRLGLLLRFARALAADVYAIMTRREQLQQFGLVTIGVFSLAFGSAIVLQHLPIDYDYHGLGPGNNAGFLDRLWWAFRQLQSADNLVPNLHVPIPIAILSLILTIVGVFVISFIIGLGANVVDQVVRAERRRAVEYSGHSLVIGPVHETEMLVAEFVRLYERNRTLRRWFRPNELLQWILGRGPLPQRHALPRMALLGTHDDPPGYLYDPGMRWVVYRQGDGWNPESLELVAAASAKRALLLSRADANTDADALTAMALASFRAHNKHAQVFVEVVDTENRRLMTRIGGPHTFPLDMPRFLGLFLCQHLVIPGVESLYTDLMTADGSEFYTHIFTDKREIEALTKLGEDGYIPFEQLADWAHEHRSVLLVGVFLGEQDSGRAKGFATLAHLVQWLNPLMEPPENSRAWQLGAREGKIPMRALRGLIGVTATYAPIRHYGLDLVLGRGIAPTRQALATDSPIVDWSRQLTLTRGVLSRVLIVGYSSALPALIRELARFMPGVEATLILGERGDERKPLRERLVSLDIGFDIDDAPPGRNGRTLPLENGGTATVYTHKGQDLSSFAVSRAKLGRPIRAVVFLSEPEAVDRDARTAMRILRFAQALERREFKCCDKLHILAEFASIQKGEHVRALIDSERCGFQSQHDLKLSLISTEHIKNYFMVHSVFVPGVAGLYDEILGEYGQEILRLEPPNVPNGSNRIRFDQIRLALASRKAIPIAIEYQDPSSDDNRIEMLLNPDSRTVFELNHIQAVYALADSRLCESPELQKLMRSESTPSVEQPSLEPEAIVN